MSSNSNGQPPPVAGLVKRRARDTMGLTRTGNQVQTAGPGKAGAQQAAAGQLGTSLSVPNHGGMAAADATGDILRAFMPQRPPLTLAGGTGAASPDAAVAKPGGAAAMPPHSHAPFGNLPAGSGLALLEAAEMAGRSSRRPSAAASGTTAGGTTAGGTTAGGTTAGGLADSLTTLLVPTAAVGATGRTRDARRQVRTHRRRRDRGSGVKGRPG